MIKISAKYKNSFIAVSLIAVFILLFSFASYQKKDTLSTSLINKEIILSGGETTVFDQSVNAFALPAPGLSSQDELLFFVGNSFFNQNWVQAPSSTTARDGLGPYFNAKSCSGCHFKDGRGQPPTIAGQLSQGFIIRLSIPGKGPHGEPLDDPNYGGQFQEHAIDGLKKEGDYTLNWEEITGNYPDGNSFVLRKPIINFGELNYGEMQQGIMYSPRVAPQMIGLGLLEAIEENTILSFADINDKNGDGISGKPNYVWNAIDQKVQLGKFGWKANQPTILQQISGAFSGDMGISTDHFPEQNIASSQNKYRDYATGGEPEIEKDDLHKLHLYSSTLAVPARRNVDDKDVMKGEKIFAEIGCDNCHIQKIQTGVHAEFSILSNQTITPYTDLLLHDMGEGLADGRPDFEATGQEWRTPPLWGIGLFQTVNKHTFYLHDGRARNLSEAILWHGGEAEKSKNEFIQLSQKQREQLIVFLGSL